MITYEEACQRRPGGDLTSQLVDAFGNPIGKTYKAHPTEAGWFIPDPAWVKENLITIPIDRLPGFPKFGGTKELSGITIHRYVAPALIQAWDDLVEAKLNKKLRSFSGCFAPRHMLHNRKKPLSTHAFGIAIDVDVPWNGYGIPFDKMQIDRDVVRIFESRGWEWGGRWSPTDGMHFQWTAPITGVRQADWRDSAFGKPTVRPDTITIKASDMAGNEVTIPHKKFIYNDTLVEVTNDDLTVSLRRIK